MATDNPTGGERPVPLSIPPAQTGFLRRELIGFKSGLEDDAETYPHRSGTRQWLADAAGYGRFLIGLDAGEIISDDHLRLLISEWAEAHDGAEHYQRVVFEHDAIAALSEQIGAGR
jgi:hypothetical protein